MPRAACLVALLGLCALYLGSAQDAALTKLEGDLPSNSLGGASQGLGRKMLEEPEENGKKRKKDDDGENTPPMEYPPIEYPPFYYYPFSYTPPAYGDSPPTGYPPYGYPPYEYPPFEDDDKSPPRPPSHQPPRPRPSPPPPRPSPPPPPPSPTPPPPSPTPLPRAGDGGDSNVNSGNEITCNITMYTGYTFSEDHVSYCATFTLNKPGVAAVQNFASVPFSWKLDDRVVSFRFSCSGSQDVNAKIKMRQFDWPFYKIIKDRAVGAAVKYVDYAVGDMANMGGGGRRSSSLAVMYDRDYTPGDVSTSTPTMALCGNS